MTRLRLLIRPDGHALLTTDGPVSPAEYDTLTQVFRSWQSGPTAVGLLPDCEVILVQDVSLELPEPVTA